MFAVIRLALTYFALVFATGFVLGVVRVSWLAPRVGPAAAELVETPFMLVAVFLWARFVTARLGAGLSGRALLGAGLLALLMLLALEFTVVLGLRGLTVEDYLAQRDPVAGTVYAVSLAVFAVMPALVARPGRRAAGRTTGLH